jgi:hypothetical protein
MKNVARLTLVAICSLVFVPVAAHAQNPAPPADSAAAKKPDSAAATETVDKSLLTGFYEIAPGRGLTITLDKDELYGAPSSGEKRKLIYQSGLAFLVEGTKMTLTFIPGPDGRATDLVMTQNGQTRMVHKTH